MLRKKLTPHVCGAGPYRSVRSGIRNSALHPVSVRLVLHLPAPVPAGRLVALVAHLRVVLDSRGVGAEHEPVLLVAEGVEDHLERVHLPQTRVAARVGRDDQRRIAVVTDDPDVDRLVVVENPHHRPFRAGLPFERLGLHEIVERRSLLPHPLVERSIDDRSLGDVCSRRHGAGTRCGGSRRLGRVARLRPGGRCARGRDDEAQHEGGFRQR